ncbi:mitochondrial ribosomal small subunit component [Microbotryomycetes sp. JL201]|nr:mitochondrial ribosomal small subunit component [Microbotryomycetes sp. JL201]
MNSRKSAKGVLSTLNRLLKSKAYVKQPPPAFYPMLAHPPPPSLVRHNAQRSLDDLPRSAIPPSTPFQQLKLKQNRGDKMTAEELELLRKGPAAFSGHDAKQTRRQPHLRARPGAKTARPMPIVFAEDRVRRQFFNDHPFEAYRPKSVNERELVQQQRGPAGTEWTELRQRTIVPTAEDAISFIVNLNSNHGVPINQAYRHGVAQFRSLRAEHELATRAARLEAAAHGAEFLGEIERGVTVEERVLDEWARGREILDRIAASQAAGVGAVSATVGDSSALPFSIDVDTSRLPASAPQVEFTGGSRYLERFREQQQQQSSADDAVQP